MTTNQSTAQDAVRLAELRVQCEGARLALQVLDLTAGTHGGFTDDTLATAWNGLHDAVAALEAQIAAATTPARVIPADEAATASLVARNID